jgi:hypothetical protein
MEVIYRNRFRDLVWFDFYLKPRTRSSQILYILLFILLGYNLFEVLKYTHLSLLTNTIVFILLVAAFLLVMIILEFIYLVFLQIVSSHQRLQVKHDSKVSVLDSGVVTESAIGRSEIKWSGIVNIQQSKNYILFFLSERAACLIPKRAFANKADADKFFAYACQLWENAKNVAVPN